MGRASDESQPRIVYGVWALGDTIHDGDDLLELFEDRGEAERLAAHPPVYNRGTKFEESPSCEVREHGLVAPR